MNPKIIYDISYMIFLLTASLIVRIELYIWSWICIDCFSEIVIITTVGCCHIYALVTKGVTCYCVSAVCIAVDTRVNSSLCVYIQSSMPTLSVSAGWVILHFLWLVTMVSGMWWYDCVYLWCHGVIWDGGLFIFMIWTRATPIIILFTVIISKYFH